MVSSEASTVVYLVTTNINNNNVDCVDRCVNTSSSTEEERILAAPVFLDVSSSDSIATPVPKTECKMHDDDEVLSLDERCITNTCSIEEGSMNSLCNEDYSCVLANNDPTSSDTTNKEKQSSRVWQTIRDDFDTSRGGDHKILRAVGRTATVNAVVAATAVLGPLAAVAGYATGGAITATRLVGEGIRHDNPKEVVKSLAVFGSATSASVAGQALTGVVAMGVLGASLPVAGAVAFTVGCVCGITAGALSEWGVDGVMKDDTKKETTDNDDDDGSNKETLNCHQTDDTVTKIPGKKDADGRKDELPTSVRVMTRIKTHNKKFVGACDTWVNRQLDRHRQRQRQLQIERDNRQA